MFYTILQVGHGFGLPHTDENFNNRDLGNCLDYTNNPENNLRPGDYNCNRLVGMYGTVGNRRLEEQLDGTVGLSPSTPSSSSSAASLLRGGAGDTINANNHISQERVFDTSSAPIVRMDDPQFAARYKEAMDELLYEIASSSSSSSSMPDDGGDGYSYRDNLQDNEDEGQERSGGWRMLRVHPRGGAFVRRLDEEVYLEVHVLYPAPSSSD